VWAVKYAWAILTGALIISVLNNAVTAARVSKLQDEVQYMRGQVSALTGECQ
jgi:hypothetical protein